MTDPIPNCPFCHTPPYVDHGDVWCIGHPPCLISGITFTDEDWRKLCRNVAAQARSCESDCDRLEEIRMVLSGDLSPSNPYAAGSIEHEIYRLRVAASKPVEKAPEPKRALPRCRLCGHEAEWHSGQEGPVSCPNYGCPLHNTYFRLSEWLLLTTPPSTIPPKLAEALKRWIDAYRQRDQLVIGVALKCAERLAAAIDAEPMLREASR